MINLKFETILAYYTTNKITIIHWCEIINKYLWSDTIPT